MAGGVVRDSAVSCPPRPPPGPSAAFLQEISADLQSCAGMSLMEKGGGALIRPWRGATGRRVWTLERYKETCVNPRAPTQGHRERASRCRTAHKSDPPVPPPFLGAPAEANGGGGRAVGASPSAPPAKRLCNGPEEDEVLANCPSLTSLT